jgi:beta-glucosidase
MLKISQTAGLPIRYNAKVQREGHIMSVSFSKITAVFCMVFACAGAKTHEPLTWYDTWPERQAAAIDPVEEAFVEQRLAQMTLEEKVGQMLMVEHNGLTPEEAKTYKIGAMLHAGGQAVFYGRTAVSLKCKNATYLNLSCWGELTDAYWHALKNASWHDNGAAIPVLWSTDAMHGAGAIHGATLFPHNIGVGAAIIGNPDNLGLYQQMQAATREQVALQGLRQIFGPTVTVARNMHWGRTYESLSENPIIQYEAAPYAVNGIQTPWMDGGEQRIAATLKHFVGDGGTTTGTGHVTKRIDSGYDPTDTAFTLPRTDRGLNEYSEEMMVNLHAPGYFSGIEAGAMSVMVSFNHWDNGPLHADPYLIQTILKDRLKFDGVVVTDWEAIAEVPGCTVEDCPQAINAGIDLFMIGFAKPNAWKDFYNNTLKHVANGEIPMSRIDDAARRMLRIKYRLGLFGEPQVPSKTYLAFGYKSVDEAQVSLNKWASLAKTLAEKSMVLMKNNDALPFDAAQFSSDMPLIVAGNALDSPAMQVGGWSLFWQGFERGDENPFYDKADYPQTVTVLDALKAQGVVVCEYKPKAPCLSKAKTALVVMGEHSYAEWYGDIHVGDAAGGNQSIAYKTIREEYAENEKLVNTLKQQGYQVITVFFSGRPLVVDALGTSDAFVAGFLPGSQGGPAVVDLLFAKDGLSFEGRLPYAWPLRVEDTAMFHGKPSHFPGDDTAWITALRKGNAKEVLVGPKHPYPYGYGL